MNNYAGTERVSQEGDGRKNSVCGLLDKASDIAGATLESMQTLAGTTSCKGVQIASLERWARKEGYWVNRPIEVLII